MSVTTRGDAQVRVLWRILGTIRQSVLLSFITVGLCLFVAGALLREGILAAYLAMWGGGLVLGGTAGYLFLWYNRRGR